MNTIRRKLYAVMCQYRKDNQLQCGDIIIQAFSENNAIRLLEVMRDTRELEQLGLTEVMVVMASEVEGCYVVPKTMQVIETRRVSLNPPFVIHIERDRNALHGAPETWYVTGHGHCGNGNDALYGTYPDFPKAEAAAKERFPYAVIKVIE